MHVHGSHRLSAIGFTVAIALGPAPAVSQSRPTIDRQVGAIVSRASVESLARASRTSTVVRVSGAMVDTIGAGTSEIRLRAGEILATAASTGHPQLDRATSIPHVDLPGSILAPAADGSVVRLGVAIETNGLFYVPADDAYIGTVRVGLVDDARPTESRALQSNVRVLLGGEGEITPDTLELDHTNLPFRAVVITARLVQADSVAFRVRPGFQPTGYAFQIAIRRPEISVVASPRSIDGFGLQRARLSVTLPAHAGAGRTVSLQGARNEPIDGTLTLSAGETRSTRIASRGIGVDTIRVSSPQLAGALTEIRYVFPTGFLIALLIGALLGTVARGVRRGSRTPQWVAVGDLARAVAFGTLTAVAYAIGVNLIGIPLPAFGGESVTLVGAAFGALLGEAAIKKLPRRATVATTPSPSGTP